MMNREEVLQSIRQSIVSRQDVLQKTLAEDFAALSEAVCGDTVDAAIISTHAAISSQFIEVENNELKAIHSALDRLDQGLYGVCEDCGKEISTDRLTALPYATRCIKCQRQHEKYN